MLNLSLALAPVREDSSGTALVAWLMIGGLAIANKAKKGWWKYGGNMVEIWWKHGGEFEIEKFGNCKGHDVIFWWEQER